MKVRRRRILLSLLAVVALIVLSVVGKTLFMGSHQVPLSKTSLPELRTGHVDRLSEAVQIHTVSNADWAHADQKAFADFHQWTKDTFPTVHQRLTRTDIEPCSVVFTWNGTDPNLPPALLLSHIDVVPVENHALGQWTHPPFSGVVADEHVWGRGTLDDKVGVVGILEAAETLLLADFQPKRTHVFAFGCDEEVGGNAGAKKIAAHFKKSETQYAYVLDEGHIIGKGLFPGTDAPIAFIGLAEKGFLTVTLTANQTGGHSSMPPKNTAVGILSKAVARLEANQMPGRLNAPTRAMFDHIAPEISFPNNMVFGNLWLFEPIVLSILTSKPTTNAGVRTTTAPTILAAGVQDNVLPKQAVAKVNFRIAPGDSIEDVLAHIRDTVDDERVVVSHEKRGFNSNPSRVSTSDSAAFRRLATSVRTVFGDETIVVPALTVAGTDARFYEPLSQEVYRFAPLELGPGDPARIHGVDERVSTANYGRAVQFYMQLIKEGDS